MVRPLTLPRSGLLGCRMLQSRDTGWGLTRTVVPAGSSQHLQIDGICVEVGGGCGGAGGRER